MAEKSYRCYKSSGDEIVARYHGRMQERWDFMTEMVTDPEVCPRLFVAGVIERKNKGFIHINGVVIPRLALVGTISCRALVSAIPFTKLEEIQTKEAALSFTLSAYEFSIFNGKGSASGSALVVSYQVSRAVMHLHRLLAEKGNARGIVFRLESIWENKELLKIKPELAHTEKVIWLSSP
ncbi:hypothetical protein HYV44_02990 [Candidatus Microgenomates bacterium]|nr:hypothetical protein [Candidatus Microgenomates bacterium]